MLEILHTYGNFAIFLNTLFNKSLARIIARMRIKKCLRLFKTQTEMTAAVSIIKQLIRFKCDQKRPQMKAVILKGQKEQEGIEKNRQRHKKTLRSRNITNKTKKVTMRNEKL